MIIGAIWDQSTNTWRRKTNKELLTETGQSISHDMKARRLRWTGHVARSNPSGSLYITMNASIEGRRPQLNIAITRTGNKPEDTAGLNTQRMEALTPITVDRKRGAMGELSIDYTSTSNFPILLTLARAKSKLILNKRCLTYKFSNVNNHRTVQWMVKAKDKQKFTAAEAEEGGALNQRTAWRWYLEVEIRRWKGRRAPGRPLMDIDQILQETV
ncbi:unnamed protein product [Nezara viridula]|uniref:Uncharacterized protein n=1 Tax=Nezara viridula TaxID=85310 RepID=A0A9P0MLR7_NEZVI|nr:unnamed protein product [Nezara viridula]